MHHCTDKYALKLDVHCFPGLQYMNLCESNLAYMGCKVCFVMRWPDVYKHLHSP